MNQWVERTIVVASDLWYGMFWPEYRPSARPAPAAELKPGALVMTAAEVAGLQTLQGYMISPERLGPGLVQEIDAAGRIRVSWSRAEVETWAEPDELVAVPDGWSLLTVLLCDGRGHRTLLRHRTAPLEHHWRAELRPQNVVRVERGDGLVWTFNFNPLDRSVFANWGCPPEDADAEAITAAELAVR